MPATLQSTVAQLVLDRPARSRLFHKLGIDFCCGGKIPLEEAARRKQLDPQTVLTMLEAIDEAGDEAEDLDVSSMSLIELCDHIEQTHHAFLKTELPRLHGMLQKVARGHGDKHPWMREVLATFEPFAQELAEHMVKEEQVLFPMIRRQEAGDLGAGDCGPTMRNPVDQLEHEHASAGAALAKLRELTGGYTPPDAACTTFRAALDALSDLERDMHRHVHKENNILFPRALEMEARTVPDSCSLR